MFAYKFISFIYLHTHICPCMSALKHVYLYAYINTHLSVGYACYMCMYIHTCLPTIIHIWINTYTLICIHFQTHMSAIIPAEVYTSIWDIQTHIYVYIHMLHIEKLNMLHIENMSLCYPMKIYDPIGY